MRQFLILLVFLAPPWKVAGAHEVIVKQCPECNGVCFPELTGGTTTLMGGGPCVNNTTWWPVCRITGKSFKLVVNECAELQWTLNYSHLKFLDSLYRASREKGDSMLVHDPGGIRIDAAPQDANSIRDYKIANFIVPYDTAVPIIIYDTINIDLDSISAQIREVQQLKEFIRLYLDSLYQASREKEDPDTLYNPKDHIIYEGGIIPIVSDKTEDITIYIREIVALDSVPIVKCKIKGSYDYIGTASHWVVDTICDTIGYRITRERVTERRVE